MINLNIDLAFSPCNLECGLSVKYYASCKLIVLSTSLKQFVDLNIYI